MAILKRWLQIGAALALVVWAGFFYHSYLQLAVPAFGPAEQAHLAVRSLVARYAVYLGIGVLSWFALHRRVTGRKRKTTPLAKGRGKVQTASKGKGLGIM